MRTLTRSACVRSRPALRMRSRRSFRYNRSTQSGRHRLGEAVNSPLRGNDLKLRYYIRSARREGGTRGEPTARLAQHRLDCIAQSQFSLYV